MINETSHPLVSIVVITYNSSKYVIETLESAKAQTYQNIELIVSDDCSTDDTIAISRKWIKENKDRFIRTDLITVDNNTGIPANCNRGVSVAKGEWVKLIAGDDILVSDAVMNVIDFVKKNIVKIVITQYQSFIENRSKIIENKIYPGEDLVEDFFEKKAHEQYQKLLRKNYPLILGLFFKYDLYISIGGFDERYELIEDLPFLLKIGRFGQKFYFLNKITLLYRQHQNSITQSTSDNLIVNKKFVDNQYRIYIDLIRGNISNLERIGIDLKYMCIFFIIRYNIKSKIIARVLLRIPLYFSPQNYINKFKYLFGNKYRNKNKTSKNI